MAKLHKSFNFISESYSFACAISDQVKPKIESDEINIPNSASQNNK